MEIKDDFVNNFTQQDLKSWINNEFTDKQIITVSNRKPIQKNDGTFKSVGGVVTALESIMNSSGGTWISPFPCDSQDSKQEGPNKQGIKYTSIDVPIPSYVYDCYYNGFSNGAIWPLCHNAFIRPIFKRSDWECYKSVNKRMAEAISSHIINGSEIIIIHDYHFALLPRYLRETHPNINIGFFWHIPWPSKDSFSIFPWSHELLDGLMACNLIGVQTKIIANNLIECTKSTIECSFDKENYMIYRNALSSYIRNYPISINDELFDNHLGNGWENRARKLLNEKKITTHPFFLGVDRADYTKGIPEKLKSFELLLDNHSHLRGRIQFLQVAVPTRINMPQFKNELERIRDLVKSINHKFEFDDWRPIRLIEDFVSHDELNYLYKMAIACVVSPLHDGMNLVAKEFVASRKDLNGVLILSKFAGAFEELAEGSITINPFDLSTILKAYEQAIEMTEIEQRRRMRLMRSKVLKANIFTWFYTLLNDLAKFQKKYCVNSTQSFKETNNISYFSPNNQST